MTTSYPPIHHHSCNRISASTALSHISAYLEAATTDASLHPNALLTENGPITPSAGATTGLVLHNLKRVEAGLKGEQLGADLGFDASGEEGISTSVAGDTVAGATEIPVGGLEREGHELEGGWQNKEEFEREQEVVQGEVGDRDNAVYGGTAEEGGLVPKVRVVKSARDKDDRRKAKKAKRLQLRAEEEAKKKRERDAEG